MKLVGVGFFVLFFREKNQKNFLCVLLLGACVVVMPASIVVGDICKDTDITDGSFAQMRGGNTRTAGYRVFLFYCEGKDLTLLRAPQESFDQTFSKVCRVPPAKRRSLVATSEILIRCFLFDFHVGASCGRRSRRENRKKQGVLSTRHAFVLKTTMFLTVSFFFCTFCVKRKSGQTVRCYFCRAIFLRTTAA